MKRLKVQLREEKDEVAEYKRQNEKLREKVRNGREASFTMFRSRWHTNPEVSGTQYGWAGSGRYITDWTLLKGEERSIEGDGQVYTVAVQEEGTLAA